MSRLPDLSPAALRAMFSQETEDNFIVLLTFSGDEIATPIRIASNYLTKISETDDDIVYGVRSRGNDFIFVPFNISLPTEEAEAAARCQITIHDATQQILPIIRTITQAPNVTIELVLASAVEANEYAEPEVEFPGFLMASITYNRDTIQGELTVESMSIEPFPAFTFVPSSFPGLF